MYIPKVKYISTSFGVNSVPYTSGNKPPAL